MISIARGRMIKCNGDYSFLCHCGKLIGRSAITYHIQSKLHQKLLKKNTSEQILNEDNKQKIKEPEFEIDSDSDLDSDSDSEIKTKTPIESEIELCITKCKNGNDFLCKCGRVICKNAIHYHIKSKIHRKLLNLKQIRESKTKSKSFIIKYEEGPFDCPWDNLIDESDKKIPNKEQNKSHNVKNIMRCYEGPFDSPYDHPLDHTDIIIFAYY
jgi:hypothetical protein